MSAERHSRQIRFGPIGKQGQERIAAARVAVLGCGALGSVIAEQLARAGIGMLRLVDRDFVEISNLQRQSLYTMADAEKLRPKAVAAAEHLQCIDPALVIEARVVDVDGASIKDLIADCQVVFDGSDNFALRHLLNEACCAAGIPWIYAACVGAYACALPILPGQGPCLACVQDEMPAPGENPTCDGVGIIAPAVHQAAAWSVGAGMRMLVGDAPAAVMQTADLWQGTMRQHDMSAWRSTDCRVCGARPVYRFLGQAHAAPQQLCGRDAVQLRLEATIELDALAARLGSLVLRQNAYLLRWEDDDVRFTAFADGRLLLQPCMDAERARVLAARWLG